MILHLDALIANKRRCYALAPCSAFCPVRRESYRQSMISHFKQLILRRIKRIRVYGSATEMEPCLTSTSRPQIRTVARMPLKSKKQVMRGLRLGHALCSFLQPERYDAWDMHNYPQLAATMQADMYRINWGMKSSAR